MPQFKKFGKAIFGVEFNKSEQKIIDDAISKLIVEHFVEFEKELDASILWMLHVHFGFGAERLHKVWKLTYEQNRGLQEHYEIDPGHAVWMCKKLLEDNKLADLDKWYAEETR